MAERPQAPSAEPWYLPPVEEPAPRPWYSVGGVGDRLRPYASQLSELLRYYNPLPHAEGPVSGAASLLTPSYGGEERSRAVQEFNRGNYGKAALATLTGTAALGLDLAPGGSTARKAGKAAGKQGVEVLEHLAERYPENAPPVVTPKDPKNLAAGTYLAKAESPEAAELMKQRALVRDDMKARGYEPFYDPAQREHVDPGYYPTDIDTVTQAVAKKPETRAKYDAHANMPDALANLRQAYEQGLTLPNTKDWYAMKQLEDSFVAELGPVKGREAFRDRFAGSMAATTGGADPEANFLMANYGNNLQARGAQYPAGAYEMPSPIGGRYASGNIDMHRKFVDQMGGSFDVGNPKRHNFQYNFLGHQNKATMDEQMMTTGWGLSLPPSGNYGNYEKVVHDLAREYGVSPQEFQAIAWSGGKNLKSGGKYAGGYPMINTVNDAIERTSRVTGQKPEDVVRHGLILGQRPVY